MIPTRTDFSDSLESLKRVSAFSYKALATELDVPVSTLHGWCTGKHLPYAREQAKFEQMLRLLGVDDPEPWSSALVELRQRPDSGNPYPGLTSFTEADADADRFHGRTALTNDLLTMVEHGLTNALQTPAIVLGPSGSGKTSLLRAGLVARIRRQTANAVLYTTPEDGIDALVADIAAWLAGHRREPAIVVVDQFEMLYASSGIDQFDSTIDHLQSFAADPDVDIVIGLRADFFQRAMATDWLRAGLSERQLIVRPLTAAEAAECIVRPAEGAGMTVEADLLAELTAEFNQRSTTDRATEALPLLSHVMFLLANEGRRVLTLDRYRALGGLGDAVSRAAEAMYQRLDDDEQKVGRRLITRLVEVGADGTLLRRHIDLDWIDSSSSRHVVELFADARLLTLGTDHVSISHDALLTGWTRLAGWIDEARTTKLVERRVATLASAWLATGRNHDALLRGSLLSEAADLLAETDDHHFGASDIDYIRASQQHHLKEVEHDAEVMSRQLALQSSLLQRNDAALSSHIAAVAVATSPTIEARSALASATSPLPGSRSLGRAGEVWLDVSGDQRTLVASNGPNGGLRVLSVDGRTLTLERELPNPFDAAITAVALDSSGSTLALGAADGSVVTIDLTKNATAEPPTTAVPNDFDGAIHALTFERTSNRLLIAGQGPAVVLVDIDSRRELTRLPVDSTVLDIAVSASGGSGASVAAAGSDGVVTVWFTASADITEITHVWRDPNPPQAAASCVRFSPAGDYLVAGYHDGRLRAFTRQDDQDPVAIALTSAPFSSWVNSVAVSANGEIVSAASSDGTVRFWTTRNWQEVRPELEHGSVVTAVRLCRDHVITAAETGTVRTWPMPMTAVAETDTTIWTTALSASGDRLLTTSRGRTALWTVDGGRLRPDPERVETGRDDLIASGAGAITADGRRIALGTRSGAVLIGAAGSSEAVRVLDGAADSLIENVAFSPDGTLLAAIEAAGTVTVWDTTNESARRIAHLAVPPRPLDLAIDATGSRLAVVSDNCELAMIDLADRAQIAVTSTSRVAESFAMSVVFHPIRPVVAIGSADRTLSFWDCSEPANPKFLSRTTGPGGHLVGLNFDGTGTRIAAASTDSTVWIWDTTDVAAPRPHLRIKASGSGAYAVALSPDGHTCFGGGPNQQIDTWLLDPDAARTVLEASTGDPITRDEWLHLVPESVPGIPTDQ